MAWSAGKALVFSEDANNTAVRPSATSAVLSDGEALMPKYDDILDAYDKATTVLSKRRGGRTNTPTKEHGGGGRGAPKDYEYLDALTVWVRAEATDPGSGDRPYWFMLWFIPDLRLPKPEWTDAEMRILMRAVRDFGCQLCVIDFVPRCPSARRGCLRKKKRS